MRRIKIKENSGLRVILPETLFCGHWLCNIRFDEKLAVTTCWARTCKEAVAGLKALSRVQEYRKTVAEVSNWALC